jgi:hypothetical protein
MISAATAMPMPEPRPSVNRTWMKANIITAAIYAAFGIITFATNKFLGIGEPATGVFFRGIGGMIVLAASVVPLVAYAMLTGAALSEKLPAFSRRGWIGLHAGIGVFFGSIFAIATLFGAGSTDAPAAMPSYTMMVIGGLLASAIFGPLFGAIVGGLQALVLRRSATGMGAWIVWSMIATTFMLAGMLLVAMLLYTPGMDPDKAGLGSTLALQVALFFVTVVSAAIMLPALNRLTPKA